MKNSELFHKTVGILVKAYQNETLRRSDCYACAVGNLVCANTGIDLKKKTHWNHQWSKVFLTIQGRFTKFNLENYTGEAKKQIDSTGYSPYNLAKVERAFETAPGYGERNEQAMFNGLMSVIDCLMEIHGANEKECAEAKELFVKV